MWSDDELKRFEYLEKITPEERELYRKRMYTGFLKRQLESLRTAALLVTSTEWTDEAHEYCLAVVDNAAPAIKSLDDQIKILTLKIKALEAQND